MKSLVTLGMKNLQDDFRESLDGKTRSFFEFVDSCSMCPWNVPLPQMHLLYVNVRENQIPWIFFLFRQNRRQKQQTWRFKMREKRAKGMLNTKWCLISCCHSLWQETLLLFFKMYILKKMTNFHSRRSRRKTFNLNCLFNIQEQDAKQPCDSTQLSWTKTIGYPGLLKYKTLHSMVMRSPDSVISVSQVLSPVSSLSPSHHWRHNNSKCIIKSLQLDSKLPKYKWQHFKSQTLSRH